MTDHLRTALIQIRDAPPPEAGLIAGVDTWCDSFEGLQKIAADALREAAKPATVLNHAVEDCRQEEEKENE